MIHTINERDEELMRKVADRDQRAFRELVELHMAESMSVAFRVLSDSVLAEEALMEAFFKVWRSAHTFQHKSSFRTWLYRIVYNTALSHRKRDRAQQHEQLLEEVENYSARMSHPMERSERAETIERSLKRLPEIQRIIVSLYYLQECSIEEIAGICGIPEGTVKTHLHRSRKKLRSDANLQAYVTE